MNRRWVVSCWVLVVWARLSEGSNSTHHEKLRGIFSPRMDYEQWKPLGRGDPLKNDPTYDYVPPVLDKVHYWMDPALRKPDPPLPGDPQKTEILLLGVSSKKPSTGTSVADSRKDNYDSFLKFVDGPKFNSNNHHQRIARPHFWPPSAFYKMKPFPEQQQQQQQRVPYTVLMPPPIVTRSPTTTETLATIVKSTTTTLPEASSTKPEVTIEASKLVYQSSSLGGLETSTSYRKELLQKHLQPPESYIQIQFSTPKNFTQKPMLVTAGSEQNINYVTPPPLLEEIMHKGEVSDDDISNTYVKIGKTEAQVLDNVLPPEILQQPMALFSHVKHPMTLQTIQTMQTMQPPPMATSPIFKKNTNPILNALERERTTSMTEAPTTASTTTSTTTEAPTTTTTTTTTTTQPQTTTSAMLTTDSLFKHYKQPAEPLRGPLYLIIQGHSKVKTYGPAKQLHGIRVQETNEISDDDVKNARRGDDRKLGRRPQGGGRRGKNLQSLQTLKHVVQTGLGAIDFGAERRRDEVKETELQYGYRVGGDATSEKYHKGIVEEARSLKL